MPADSQSDLKPRIGNDESLPDVMTIPSRLPTTIIHPVPPTPIRDKIGRYTVEPVLGEGSFGTVLLARDDDLQRPVAIKVPRRNRFGSSTEAATFIEEARTVARLRHPGIVAVHDVGRTEDDFPFVVLEYIDGPSLHAEMQARPMSARRAAELLAAIADAVAFAHKQGFIHRDLKPANILLDAQGLPHVSDFGLALHESQQAERSGEYAGTVAYMSPEQVRGEAHRLDGRTDIWALGVILYRMLTRRLPFSGSSVHELSDEIQHRDPKPPRQIDETIPAELERIINRCCQKKVAERYSTASDLATDLRNWLNREMPSGSSVPHSENAKSAPHQPAGLDAETIRMNSESTRCSGPKNGRNRLFDIIAVMCCTVIGLVGIWKGLPWLNSQPVTNQPASLVAGMDSQLKGTLDILIWNKLRSRQGLHIRDPEIRSLRHDDQVRVEARTNQPAYLYLIWIDAAGKVQPLYPWEPGHWDRRPSQEIPVQQVALPEMTDTGWPIEGAAGMETLVLLANDVPLTEDHIFDLRKALNELPPQSAQQSGSLVEFVNGHIISVEQDRDRGPKLYDPRRIDDPVLQTQARLLAALVNRVRYLRAISFANQGSAIP